MPSSLLSPATSNLVQKRHAYYDRYSVEESTLVCKPKYKLACNRFINVYYFYVLTSRKSSCSHRFRYCFKRTDWEVIVGHHLNGTESFTDLKKIDVLDEKELRLKQTDAKNKFCLAAILRSDKYEDFVRFYESNKHLKYLPAKQKLSIASALRKESDEEMAVAALGKLGLG